VLSFVCRWECIFLETRLQYWSCGSSQAHIDFRTNDEGSTSQSPGGVSSHSFRFHAGTPSPDIISASVVDVTVDCDKKVSTPDQCDVGRVSRGRHLEDQCLESQTAPKVDQFYCAPMIPEKVLHQSAPWIVHYCLSPPSTACQ
jgi:hypothetical protein